ncbi:MAG TPA: histidine kinase [Burkholderiaceae bacterium]|jgi:sensor histidine kinase YesM
MAAVFDPPTANIVATRRARFAMRGLRTLLVCVLIAVMLTGLMGGSFWITLVHSICIGVCCWLAIDLGRIQLARWEHRHAPEAPEAQSQWPGWPLMLAMVLVGTVVGFSVGNELAHWITGVKSPGFFRGDWFQALQLLAGSLVPGAAITYYYYSREKTAAQEASLQAAVQTAQRQAAEHQLKLLESQLEPHMLFNTLANLRVLIGIDPTRAQLMLDQLIGFLRATLSASRASQHPLSAEFARLADYLALMKIRMGERLQTRFELPPDLAAAPVPPLLLQPLVENCIKHGLEPNVAGGRVEVSARREGETLVLQVRDTGAGLSQASGDGTRFGLVQVRERLATLYGDGASLTLQAASDAEGGTLATIRLPGADAPTQAAP